jgi:hypothetical protein
MPEHTPPAYGAERFTLTRDGADHVITRRVWTDEGHTTFYDDETHDFVTWAGSWVRIEELGRFPSREAATQHMIARGGREEAGDAR